MSEGSVQSLQEIMLTAKTSIRSVSLEDLRFHAIPLGIDVSSFGKKKFELLEAITQKVGENPVQNATESPTTAFVEEEVVAPLDELETPSEGIKSGPGRGRKVKISRKEDDPYAYHVWINMESSKMSPWSKGQRVMFRVGGEMLEGQPNKLFSTEIGIVHWTTHTAEGLIGVGMLRDNGTVVTVLPEWIKSGPVPDQEKKRRRKKKESTENED